MSWRFRKSFSPLPGVRITLSPSGVSTSVGAGPFRATFGANGTSVTTRIPGSGLSYKQNIGSPLSHQNSQSHQQENAVHHNLPSSDTHEIGDIKSAGSRSLTTTGLTEFKRLLESASREHDQIVSELSEAKHEESIKVGRYLSWQHGWLRKRLFPKWFERIKVVSQDAIGKRAELEEQEHLAKLQTHIDIPEHVAQSYNQLIDQFSVLTNCDHIWDTTGQRATNRAAERTMATRVVSRAPVSFELGRCEIIASEWTVPHLENANGGDIYLYPAFVLYFVTADSFALLEYKDISVTFELSNFIEEENIPHDTRTVGYTWAKVNKDGSPDKRFKGNYQIPIAEYGRISIKSNTGMNEEYLFSNAEKTKSFYTAWQNFFKSVRSGESR